MRWLFRSLAVIAVLWTGYAASPYIAAYRLVDALAKRDTDAVKGHVNFNALRVSLTKQLVSAYVAAMPHASEKTASDRQLAIGAVLAVAHPLLAQFLSGEGVIALFSAAEAASEGTAAGRPRTADSSAAASAVSLRSLAPASLLGFLASSRAHGFRTMYFALPEGRPPEEQFRLQFRFSRFRWRLVGLDLPAALRRRLVQDIAERLSGGRDPAAAPPG